MKVRCERDKTVFEAVIEPYPNQDRQTHFYDQHGDRRIICPICGRVYFHYNRMGKKGWICGSLTLTIFKE